VDFLNRLIPDLYASAIPDREMMLYMLKTGQDLDWRNKFYVSSFRRKLSSMGIHANIPEPTPIAIPHEVQQALAAN